MDIYIEGQKAKVVMVGTGTRAEQLWPETKYYDTVVEFTRSSSLDKLPISGFDARTSTDSSPVPAVYAAGRLYAQANVGVSYQYRLLDRKYSGNEMSIETVLPPTLNTNYMPSGLVLAGNPSTNEFVVLEYSAYALALKYIKGTETQVGYIVNYNLPPNGRLKVSRFMGWVRIFVNDVPIGASYNPFYEMAGYPGVNLYSATELNQSTPIGKTTFRGSTNSNKENRGVEPLSRVDVPLKRWTPIGYMQLLGGYTCRFYLKARWTNGTSFSTRQFEIWMNGSRIWYWNDQNGGDNITTDPIVVPANSTIEVRAYSDSDVLQNRTLQRGNEIRYQIV